MGDGRVERNRPSCARRAMSQQLLYRYDYLYHLYRSSFRAARRFATIGAFGDISRPRSSSSSSSSSSCFLRLFVRYLLLQQLLQWVFCGNSSVSGNCCGPYIGMVASWTTGAAVLNHPRHHISTATKRPSIPASLSSSSSSSSSPLQRQEHSNPRLCPFTDAMAPILPRPQWLSWQELKWIYQPQLQQPQQPQMQPQQIEMQQMLQRANAQGLWPTSIDCHWYTACIVSRICTSTMQTTCGG